MATFQINSEECFMYAYLDGRIDCTDGLAMLIADRIENACNAAGIKIQATGSGQSEARYINFYNEQQEREFCVRVAGHSARSYNSQPDFEISLGEVNENTSEFVAFSEYSENEEFTDTYVDCDEDGEEITVEYTDFRQVDYFEFDDEQVEAAVEAAVKFILKNKGE